MRYLLPLVIADFDGQAAIAYEQVRAVLEAQGTPIGPF